ncbi:CatB-related O-acetyltransferase [Lutibacter sp.]|uniref:CatB-related O-acetyltransferase n=1 Tax=Lutibacter sp. TaxID=1925666 RepID=UPI0025C3C862|nr:CatB-related O-acetyltransferase [Lutibacter sp.]MCF6168485.1 CatB-related O-acetyltransferase [Lutibacter sp.]
MFFWIRKILWRILGFDYQMMLNKTDYVLLKNDNFTQKGIRTYDNGAKVWRWTNAPLIIGKYCSIAYDVNFIVDEGYHSMSAITNFPLYNNLFKEDILKKPNLTNDFFKNHQQKEGISIGNDVWIGMGVYIMPGVTVGNGVTIAANSVVTNDVEDYCLIGGSPAKMIKKKHSDNQIEKLNKIAWWNWDENEIKNKINDFQLDINQFIKKYY